METRYWHNGIEITFEERTAKFVATVNGSKVQATSLAGIKKKIDTLNTFTRFKALGFTWGNRIEEFEIVGARKARSKYNDRPMWIDSSGREHSRVIVATPQNRVLCEKLKALSDEHEAIEKQQKEARRAIDAAIPRIDPDDLNKAPAAAPEVAND